MTTYTKQQLQEIPPVAHVTVHTDEGSVSGIFDGAFVKCGKCTGVQVLDRPPFGVRFLSAEGISVVEVNV